MAASSFNPIHIHNAPIMHRVYNNPPPGPFIRNQHPYQVQVNYHQPNYYPFPPGFDPSVSLAHPYIYDPTQVKHRRRTTPEQLKVLEDTFKTDPKPNPNLRKKLSVELGMSPRVLQVWFQNRRMKVKRLAKKQTVAEQRSGSPDLDAKDGDQDQDGSTSPDVSTTHSPPKSTSSPVSGTPLSADHESPSSPAPSTPSPGCQHTPVDRLSPASALRFAPSVDLGRRGSLPVLSTSNFSLSPDPTSPVTADSDRERIRPGSSSAIEGVTDPALFRRRSMTSLHRLDSHPFAPLVAASNGIPQPDQQRQNFTPIVPPSLPPSFRTPRHASTAFYHHHHSPSTPAPRLTGMPGVTPQTMRAASFHVIPNEHQAHTFPQQHQHTLMQQPYAFPPRPIPAPGPGPLPAADYSFGTSTPPCAEDTQEEYDVRPYVPSSVSQGSYSVQATAAAAAGVAFSVPRLIRQDDDTDASTSYTGYSSRFGSIASVAESDASTGASLGGGTASASSTSGSMASIGGWEGDHWAEEGRRGSWTGQVAEMMSGLDVRGDSGKTDDMTYESMWNQSPHLTRGASYASSGSQESLGAYAHPPNVDEAKEEGHELSYPESEESTPPAPAPQPQFDRARYSISQSSELTYALCGDKQQQQQQQQQHLAFPSSGQSQAGDEMLEMHHALAAYADHSSVDELTSPYSIGAFSTREQDDATSYSMY